MISGAELQKNKIWLGTVKQGVGGGGGGGIAKGDIYV